MLDDRGFDLWAGVYDRDVRESDERNEYPFAGYRKLMMTMDQRIREHGGRRILDLGVGTGFLSKILYDDGYSITGIDFSREMLTMARERMPRGLFIEADLTQGLPSKLRGEVFDLAISTYALHHFDQAGKLRLIRDLVPLLDPKGLILIGDIAFADRASLGLCRESTDEWDDGEDYLVFEEIRPHLLDYQPQFETISHTAGILALQLSPEGKWNHG